MLRWPLRIGAGALVVAIAYLAITFVQVFQASRHDGAERAQAIVVFGAAQYNGTPSPVLRARLDHAAKLYQRGYADRLVVTGGRLPEDRFSEATASARYLRSKGVPDSSILREVEGRTSWQSLASAARFLKQRGVTDVVLVSDGFHSARIGAMASELGLKAHTSPTTTSPITGTETLPYLGKETLAVAAGRVLGFRRVSNAGQNVASG
ncbi:MAG TPA: YdcF family protein [Acidimicrobiales bacterium]|nr:YdcF family protein [Acidimicrobiales bacterium]